MESVGKYKKLISSLEKIIFNLIIIAHQFLILKNVYTYVEFISIVILIKIFGRQHAI